MVLIVVAVVFVATVAVAIVDAAAVSASRNPFAKLERLLVCVSSAMPLNSSVCVYSLCLKTSLPSPSLHTVYLRSFCSESQSTRDSVSFCSSRALWVHVHESSRVASENNQCQSSTQNIEARTHRCIMYRFIAGERSLLWLSASASTFST